MKFNVYDYRITFNVIQSVFKAKVANDLEMTLTRPWPDFDMTLGLVTISKTNCYA